MKISVTNKKSSKKVFGKTTHHTRHIHIQRDMNNNKMERLNGEIRDREKVFRGLKKMDTPILEGMKAYYNFSKKHGFPSVLAIYFNQGFP